MAKRNAYRYFLAGWEARKVRDAEIARDLDIDPSNADSNGCLTNAQDRWVMGVFDANEQIAAAIKEAE